MADYKILTIPFGRDAVPDMVNDIPSDPIVAEPQRASFKQGFPSITTIPLTAGGIPPEGQDFNGILRDITEHVVHQNKGGMYKFAAEIVAAGGYPQGAVLAANDGLSLWVSLIDNNVQDFNSGTPTQWARIAFSGLDSLLNEKLDKASKATQAQAEAGTDNTNYSTSLRVFQALRSAAANATETLLGVLRVGTQTEVDAGTVDNVVVTPKKLFNGTLIVSSTYMALKLPSWLGGWIFQRGTVTVSGEAGGSSVVSVTLPLQYVSGYSVAAQFCYTGAILDNANIAQVRGKSLTGFTVDNQWVGNGNNLSGTIDFMTIGK